MKRLLSTLLIVLVACSFVFAQGAKEPTAGDVPTITWLIRQSAPVREAEIEAAANAILVDAVGCKLDIQFIDPGAYGDKLNMKFAAGEEFDLCFVANWINPNYQSLATKGALTPITSYISPENTPNISKAISDLIWKGVKIGGEVYGIPNLQMMYNEPGLYFVKSIAEAAGIVDAIHDHMTIEEVDAVLEKIHAYDPSLVTARDAFELSWGDYLRYAEFGANDFRYDIKTGEVVLKATTDASMALYERARNWYEKGYIRSDASTTTMEQTWRTTGKLAVRYNKNYPGVATDLANNFPPHEYICVATDPAVIGTNAITSTLTAVNANSKNPELAVKFYDFLFGSPELYNLIVSGIEGVDYDMNENGRLVKRADSYNGTNWMMGNTFNGYLKSNQDPANVAATKTVNEEAHVEILTGFVFDDANMKAELAAIGGICNEYYTILKYGLVASSQTDAKVAEMVAKCENAGLAKVTAELKGQINTFLGK